MEEHHSLFGLLVLSLGNATLIGLGVVEDPETRTISKNLAAAQYNIDLLETLQSKTRGNLTKDEAEMLERLLYDLRLKYLAAK